MFSVIYGALLNPFPYVQSERMMQLALRDETGRMRYPGMSGVLLEQLRQARTIPSGVTVLLLAVAAVACLASARRAASIDPMDAVRHE